MDPQANLPTRVPALSASPLPLPSPSHPHFARTPPDTGPTSHTYPSGVGAAGLRRPFSWQRCQERILGLPFKNVLSLAGPLRAGNSRPGIFPIFCRLFLLFQWFYYFPFCSSPSFRFQYGRSGQMAAEGGDLAFAEAGAVARASCAEGGDGMKEDTGGEQGSETSGRAASWSSGDFHSIQLWAHGLVFFWPPPKMHICSLGG